MELIHVTRKTRLCVISENIRVDIKQKLIIFAAAKAKHELRISIALITLLFTNISRPSAEVVLCSHASMNREASLYNKNTTWHNSPDTLIENIHSELSCENTHPQVKWKAINTQN